MVKHNCVHSKDIENRLQYNSKENTLLIHLEGLNIDDQKDVRIMHETIVDYIRQKVQKETVHALVKYDGFRISDRVCSEFALVCQNLCSKYYDTIHRYITQEGEDRQLVKLVKEWKKQNVKGSTLWKENIGKYVLTNEVASGSFGLVRMAVHQDSGQKVAIKVIEKQNVCLTSKYEVEILRKLNHENIIQFIDVVETPEYDYIIMEYAQGGSLDDILEYESVFDENRARKFFKQIVRAVAYMHKMGVIHRDLQLRNIVLDANENVKIIDFGTADTYIPNEPSHELFCGNIEYAAPEMIMGKKYIGPEVDVWSLGVILFKMVTGYIPFRYSKDAICGKFSVPLEEEEISEECKDLLRKILVLDTSKRCTIKEILEHAWMKKDENVL